MGSQDQDSQSEPASPTATLAELQGKLAEARKAKGRKSKAKKDEISMLEEQISALQPQAPATDFPLRESTPILTAQNEELRVNMTMLEKSAFPPSVDRLLYFGPDGAAFLNLSPLEKLKLFETKFKAGRIDPQHVALIDDKSGSTRVIYKTKTRWQSKFITPFKTAFQNDNCAFIYLVFRDEPGMAAIVPSLLLPPQYVPGGRGHIQIQLPIPGPLIGFAFKQQSSALAFTGLTNALRTNSDYIVPGTEARFNPTAFLKDLTKKVIAEALEMDGAARGGFDKLATAVNDFSNDYVLDLADHQRTGDATLRNDGWKSMIEIKDGLLTETTNDVVVNIGFLALRAKERIKACSMFHPLRQWTYICIFSQNGRVVYWIPCSVVEPSWWTDQTEIIIPKHKVQDYRIAISDKRWFRNAEAIIAKDPTPRRSAELLSCSTSQDIERYLAYNIPVMESEAQQVDEIDQMPSKASKAASKEAIGNKNVSKGTYDWKRERFNAQCRKNGFGVLLPIGKEKNPGTEAFTICRWSKEDKFRYDKNARKLPMSLHAGHFKPYQTFLMVRSLGVQVAKTSGLVGMYKVSVQAIAKPRRPVVFAIDCIGTEDRSMPGSHFLIPSECIDYKSLYKHLAKYTGTKVTCVADFVDLVRAKKVRLSQHPGARVDLRSFLFNRIVNEFIVRDDQDYHKALIDFSMAHGQGREKLVPWYRYRGYVKVNRKWVKSEPLHVTGNYMWSFKQIAQETMNDFIALRSRGGADEEEEDEEEDDDEV
ncbi:hypothetical protein M409DRAFT_23853 [Zasmidium cellare ATCC 36951]|uniref:Uncharacterized protein n=1 Tax=Zasmidium cellare ATCC 36951 TaxID=1080233 RepID=A0A6A6CFZ2_ZASCE|nr:uncharacterized protein M409DRAFT_23853 [Zasmidium cellare ATCC 36951]KAF2166124.1 hypothetical protein M409DRAFT_23853 [Zasmidium cellare ATCC 36951]